MFKFKLLVPRLYIVDLVFIYGICSVNFLGLVLLGKLLEHIFATPYLISTFEIFKFSISI